MLPLLLPPRYPHQARAATYTRKPCVTRKELDNGTETPSGCFLDDAVVAKTKLSDKNTSILLWIWSPICNKLRVWLGFISNLGVRVPIGSFKGKFMQLVCL